MKQSSILTLIILAIFLPSCEERISPKTNPITLITTPSPITSKAIDILTARSWQYYEVLEFRGGKMIPQFSKPNSIGLDSDFGATQISYKSDGSRETELNGKISKAKWKLSTNEKLLTITDSDGRESIFDVLTINKTKLEISITTKVESIAKNAIGIIKPQSLGLLDNSSENTVIFSFVPI